MMEEYKRRIELFSLYDHTNIEKHLEKMAAKGWMIEKIGSYFWHYKKIEPQKLRFSVVYYPKEVKEGIIVSDDRQNFIDMCSAGGWNYVINSGKMHIFSTDDKNAPPIDTDAEIQIECIHKFAKNEIVYGYLFFIIACILFFIFGGYKLWKEPVDTLTDLSYSVYFWLLPASFVFSVYNIISYLSWYKKAKSAAENGEFTDTKRIIRFEVLLWAPMYFAFGLLTLLRLTRIRYTLLVLGIILSGIILYLIFKAIKKVLNKSERKPNTKRRLKRFVAVILVFIWIGSGIGAYIAIPKPYYKVKAESHLSGNTVTEKVYFDKDAPLDIGDFKDTSGKTVSREKTFTESFLLKETNWRIYTIEEDAGMFFRYTITDVRFTLLLERCKNEIIFNHIVYEGKEIKLTDKYECYRYYIDDETPTNGFAFCNGNRIVTADFGWEPSEEELIFAAERLLNSQNTYLF